MPAPHPGFRILTRSIAYQGFTRIEVLEIEQTRSTGETMRMRREVETHGSGAAVLPYDPVRRTAILVRQLRIPVGLALPDRAFVLEAIAGLIDHGQSPPETARREAHEEAGLRLTHVEEIAAAFSSPGISSERLHLFLAEIDHATARIADGGGLAEEHEDIEVIELPLADLARQADAGEILDLKTFALIQTLRLRRPDLFN